MDFDLRIAKASSSKDSNGLHFLLLFAVYFSFKFWYMFQKKLKSASCMNVHNDKKKRKKRKQRKQNFFPQNSAQE